MTESPHSGPPLASDEVLERIATGESVRSLARELGIAHTTLGRRLQRPEVVRKRRAAQQRVRAEHAKERRVEREVRRRARRHAASGRDLQALAGPDHASRNDELAAQAVATGGGVHELIETTGLRTRLGVYESIDPQLVVQGLANDRSPLRDPLDAVAFRRLVPDPALISRRAAGESLRRLARDYGVSASTLSRYFARPEVAEAVRSRQLEIEEQRTKETERHQSHVALAEHLAGKISQVRCPVHNRRTYVRSRDTSESETCLEVVGCCDESIAELVRWLRIHRAVLSTGAVFTPSGHAPLNATVPPA